MNTLHSLAVYGFDNWFETRAATDCTEKDHVARVIAVDRDQYLMLDESGTHRARLAGKFRHDTHTHEQLPCVGDWVCVEKHPADEIGLIHAVLERKTCLRRKAVGQTFDYQMIAANIDVVFVVQSCHYDFNLKRLERYLVMVADGGAQAVILLTKTDLVSPEMLEEQISQIRKVGINVRIQTLSNLTGQGIDELRQSLLPGKTCCFVGSSGVGKSSMINHLLGEHKLVTRQVSGSGEGTHATVRRELVVLNGGAMVIDNPGMREFGVMASGDAIDAGFVDIDQLAEGCRFNDCSHTNEPGCAVLEALDEGRISMAHLENYRKLCEESRFNQMSYAEKRKKDRAFGQYVKKVKKDLYPKN